MTFNLFVGLQIYEKRQKCKRLDIKKSLKLMKISAVKSLRICKIKMTDVQLGLCLSCIYPSRLCLHTKTNCATKTG
jgi:hypothetical protein